MVGDSGTRFLSDALIIYNGSSRNSEHAEFPLRISACSRGIIGLNRVRICTLTTCRNATSTFFEYLDGGER